METKLYTLRISRQHIRVNVSVCSHIDLLNVEWPLVTLVPHSAPTRLTLSVVSTLLFAADTEVMKLLLRNLQVPSHMASRV